MTAHPYDDLQAFALGDLDGVAAEAVLQHTDACPTCAAVLADSMRGVSALAGLEERREAPAVVAITSRRTRGRWMLGLASAAAVVLGVWNVELRATAPVVPVDAIVHSHFTHHPLTGREGSAKLVQSLDGSWIYLIADGLRPLARYELDINGSPAGTIHADFAGRATAYWTRPAGAIKQAELVGPAGTALRWSEK